MVRRVDSSDGPYGRRSGRARNCDDLRHPPFSGDIADGFIWGRGTLDDKCAVGPLLEAVEKLVKERVPAALRRSFWPLATTKKSAARLRLPDREIAETDERSISNMFLTRDWPSLMESSPGSKEQSCSDRNR